MLELLNKGKCEDISILEVHEKYHLVEKPEDDYFGHLLVPWRIILKCPLKNRCEGVH